MGVVTVKLVAPLRASAWRALAAVVLAGSVLAPLGAVVHALPAGAATCTIDVQCNGTLTASTSAAEPGTTIQIHVETHMDDNICVGLRSDHPDGSTIGDSDTPADATPKPDGSLSWPVTYANTGPVTYSVVFLGNALGNNGCLYDQSVLLDATVTVDWVVPTKSLNSTVTVSPAITLADGQSPATVTVVVTDGRGAPANDEVRLAGTGSAQVTPAQVTAGTGGVATFTLTDTSPETLSMHAQYLSTDLFGNPVWSDIKQHAEVEFVGSDAVERVNSNLAASLSRIPADGVSTSTLTASLEDASGPLPGRSVKITYSGSAAISSQVATTNGEGRAFFVVSDRSVEDVTFTATDTISGLVVGQAGVRFGQPADAEQDLSMLSLTPSGEVVTDIIVPDDGTTAAAVYVQLRCQDNENGCDGGGTALYQPDEGSPTGTITKAQVTLVPTGSTTAKTTAVLDPTNFLGQARFQVTDTVPETVTYNAVDTTNNMMLAKVDHSSEPPTITPLKVTIHFTGPGTPSATTSSAVADPPSVAADGVTASTITVTLRDANRILVSGKTVTLSPGRGQATFTPAQVITDRHGEADFSVVDTRVETVSFLVNDVSDNVALTTLPQVTFTSGGPSSSVSTITASPASVPADGTTTSTVSVTISDPSGNPLTGKTISLSQGGGRSTIGAPSGATDANGVTTFAVTDATPEAVIYSARDETDGFDLSRTATVTFTGKPTSANSTIAADPASVPANALTASTVTVTLKDQNGNAVSGKAVTLQQNGVSRINPLVPGSDVSDQQGMAVFAVTDDTTQKVTYIATDTTDRISLTGSTAVTFTGSPSGGNSTVVANPTNLPADGVSASTITVTLLDGIGQPIPGHNITLAPTSASHSTLTLASPGSNTTNASGAAAFTATDLFGETVTYSATDTSVNPAQKLFPTATVTFAPTPAVSSVSPNYGPPGGGTKVTISGPNLAGATGVMFGDKAAANVSVNRKTGAVSATSPSGAGTVPVVVMTPAGPTPASPAAQFRYGPAVTGVSPTSGSSSGGTKVTISGNNLSGVTAVSFGGTQVTKFTRTSGSTIVLTSPPGVPGTVDIRVTTPGGSSEIQPADHFTYT